MTSSDLVLDRAGMPVAQPRDGVLDPAALVEEQLTEVCGVDRAQRLSFLSTPARSGEASRRSISAGPIPVSSTIFSRAP